MAMTKVKDAVVKLREYTDRDGNKKAQWGNVGSLMRGDDGNEFLLLDRHFNPAGIPNPDHRGNILISFFDVKKDDQGGRQSGGNRGGGKQYDPSARTDMDEEIPF